jgi:hypothetical protein
MDGSKEEMGLRRMKAAIEVMSRKELGRYKASRVSVICLPEPQNATLG